MAKQNVQDRGAQMQSADSYVKFRGMQRKKDIGLFAKPSRLVKLKKALPHHGRNAFNVH